MTGAGETGLQTAAEPRLTVDCKASPAVLLVGHARTIFVPERVIVSCAVAGPTSIKPRLDNTAARRHLRNRQVFTFTFVLTAIPFQQKSLHLLNQARPEALAAPKNGEPV
jgi:hypothetical protein